MLQQTTRNQLCGFDKPLSALNYHHLVWDFPDELNAALSNIKLSTKLSKAKSGRAPSMFNLDQLKTESYYRLIDSISFTINPKNYSVDCYENVAKIQKKLLTTLGSDDVLLNNPEYFDKSLESFQKLERIKYENKGLQAELFEEKRSVKDELICKEQKDLYVNRFTYKLAKPASLESCDCSEIFLESEYECDSFDVNTTEITDTGDFDFLDLYIWAEKLINDQLINRTLVRNPENSVKLPVDQPELVTTTEAVRSLSLDNASTTPGQNKSSAKRKTADSEEIVEVVKPKKCGCF